MVVVVYMHKNFVDCATYVRLDQDAGDLLVTALACKHERRAVILISRINGHPRLEQQDGENSVIVMRKKMLLNLSSTHR